MPAASVFLDSNVLLYTLEAPFAAKSEMARSWLREASSRRAARANLQVLNETTNVLLRKRIDLSAAQIFAAVDGLAFLGTWPISMSTGEFARHVRLTTHYRWWDCLLLASAVELGCTHFLSEDLQDGRLVEGVTIFDPFAHRPEELFSPS